MINKLRLLVAPKNETTLYLAVRRKSLSAGEIHYNRFESVHQRGQEQKRCQK